MNILAFDTSSPVLSVAIKKDDSSIDEKVLDNQLKHSEYLLPIIDECLRSSKLTLSEIDLFLIGRGPGSFTGLRVGFATLKGFIASLSKPCFGAHTLDLISRNVPAANSPLYICLDAFRERFYVKKYENKNGVWKSSTDVEILQHEELFPKLEEDSIICGDALSRYKQKFLDCRKPLNLISKENWYPKASTLIEFYENQSESIYELKSPEDFLPVYMRKSEAEERLEEKSL